MLDPAYCNPDSEADDRAEVLDERLQREFDAGEHDEEFGQWFREDYFGQGAHGGLFREAFLDYLFEQASQPKAAEPKEEV